MQEQPRPHYRSAEQTTSSFGIRHIATWFLIATAAIVALTGAYFWGASNASVTRVEILIPTPAPAVVQIVGEVQSPGVYELNRDTRILDAIEAAGGITESAAIESINLAANVKDGSRIFVPALIPTSGTARNENLATEDSSQNGTTRTATNEVQISELPDFPLDLNTASIEQLKSLPGIGDTRANQIIDFRTSVGGFSTIEQLLDISGIGTKTLEAIRPLVVIR